jgi:type 1 glutamine amidotransferase
VIHRKALVVRGGWEGHKPVKSTEMFLPFLEQNGYTVRVEASPAVYADPIEMAGTDLIVQCLTMGEITREQLRGLRAAVEAGTGFTGWHGGIVDSFRASADYLQLIGGQFVTHPGKDPAVCVGDDSDKILPHTVTITDLGRAHPVTVGLDDFQLRTEQYWVLHDDLIDVLATLTHPAHPWQPWHRPIVSPAVWTRHWGAGRVMVTTPGHTLDVLEETHIRTIIERGMLWATRG